MQQNQYLQHLAQYGLPPAVHVAQPGLVSMRTAIANVCLVGEPGTTDWALVDAGVYFYGEQIAETAEAFFQGPPKAILLTHGHFDHIGSLQELLDCWDVPVYAHELELPYLTGRANYVEPDPSVGGGLLARLSFLYPNEGINLGDRVQVLPQDGSIPGLPEWRWVHTPGHTVGHVSLFRDKDRALIAGDAFITVKQESALAVMSQEKEIHGPPMYFTPDWQAAWESVRQLEALKPAVALTGHGLPMAGDELASGLETLVRNFDKMAIPDHGRFVQ